MPTCKSIAPILQVSNLDHAIDFWKRVMAFDVAWIAGGEPPDIASVCRDQIYLMVRVEKKPLPCDIYIEVEDIDDYFRHLREVGAKIVYDLADRAYGMRDGRIEDRDRTQITLGQAIAKP